MAASEKSSGGDRASSAAFSGEVDQTITANEESPPGSMASGPSGRNLWKAVQVALSNWTVETTALWEYPQPTVRIPASWRTLDLAPSAATWQNFIEEVKNKERGKIEYKKGQKKD